LDLLIAGAFGGVQKGYSKEGRFKLLTPKIRRAFNKDAFILDSSKDPFLEQTQVD